MRRLVSMLSMLLVLLAPCGAAAQDVVIGDASSFCDTGPWASRSDVEGGTLWVIPKCETLKLESLDTQNPVVASALAEWRRELAPLPLPVAQAYRYRLKAINTRRRVMEMSLGDVEFFLSPFGQLTGTFGVRLAPCSQIEFSFVSPGRPMELHSSLNWAELDNPRDGNWKPFFVTRAMVFIPRVWLYYAEPTRAGPIVPDESDNLDTPLKCE